MSYPGRRYGRRFGPNLKLTPATIDAICKSFVALPVWSDAAWKAGIPSRTFDRWKARAKAAYDAWEDIAEAGTGDTFNEDEDMAMLRDMHMSMMTAEAEAKINAAAGVMKGSRGWQGKMAILERRFPADYGKVTKTELTGANGGPVQTESGTEALARLKAELDAAERDPS